MKLRKSLKFAINMVLHSKLRSWLTILGIVIGVASVIAIISLGEGMKQSLNSQLGGLGGDLVTVSPGFSSSSKFTHGRGPGGGGGSSSVATEEEVDQVIGQALKAGATLAKKAQKASWGGYSGYFKDPDGHLWEIAHNPFFWIGPEDD